MLVFPGPAVMYIVTRSVAQGTGAGLASAIGLSTGAAVHVAAASLGISALIAASATAFNVLKLAGAAYLVFLGLKTLASSGNGSTGEVRRGTLMQCFRQGVVVNLLNPKLGLFFVSFLPHFVDPTAGRPGAQIAVLGTVLVLLGMVTDAAYAVLAGTVSRALRRNPRSMRRLRVGSGLTYLALGVVAAFTGTRD